MDAPSEQSLSLCDWVMAKLNKHTQRDSWLREATGFPFLLENVCLPQQYEKMKALRIVSAHSLKSLKIRGLCSLAEGVESLSSTLGQLCLEESYLSCLFIFIF